MRRTAGLSWVGCVAVSVTLVACGGGGGASSSSPTSPTTNPGQPSQPTLAACSVIGGFAAAAIGDVQSIVKGTQCSSANTPVVLLNLKDKDGQQVGRCSGTIISRRAVLTAAHCLLGEAASVLVYQGTGVQIPSASIHAHPTYRESDNSGLDVGVVLTSADLDHPIVPLLLSRDASVGEQAVIAGWGNDEFGSSATAPKAALTVISAVYSNYLQTEISATGSGVCSGDSGGPILLAQGGVWSIGGITSAASTGGSCTVGSNYFTNIRNASVQSFVTGLVPDATQR